MNDNSHHGKECECDHFHVIRKVNMCWCKLLKTTCPRDMFTPNSHRITGLTNSITTIVQCDALQQLQSYDEHLSSLCGASRIRKWSVLDVFAAPSTTLSAAHGVDTPSNTEPNLILCSGSLASFGVGYFGGRSKAENQRTLEKDIR